MQSCLFYQGFSFVRGHVGRYGSSVVHLLGGVHTMGLGFHLGIAAELKEKLLEKEEVQAR